MTLMRCRTCSSRTLRWCRRAWYRRKFFADVWARSRRKGDRSTNRSRRTCGVHWTRSRQVAQVWVLSEIGVTASSERQRGLRLWYRVRAAP